MTVGTIVTEQGIGKNLPTASTNIIKMTQLRLFPASQIVRLQRPRESALITHREVYRSLSLEGFTALNSLTLPLMTTSIYQYSCLHRLVRPTSIEGLMPPQMLTANPAVAPVVCMCGAIDLGRDHDAMM